MATPGLDIDVIVREVLARLTAAATPLASSVSSSPLANASARASVTSDPPAVPAAAWPTRTNDDVLLADSVITLKSLEGRTAGTRRVLVAPRAVVTPAARDWLQHQGIELIRATVPAVAAATSNNPATRPAVGKLYLHATTGLVRTPSWTQTASDHGWELESLVPCPTPQAVAELSAVLGPRQRLGVLLTRDVPLALCLANRRVNVRAAEAATVDATRDAVRQIHANLLVVDPSRSGEFVRKRIVQEFLRPGPREAPTDWRGGS